MEQTGDPNNVWFSLPEEASNEALRANGISDQACQIDAEAELRRVAPDYEVTRENARDLSIRAALLFDPAVAYHAQNMPTQSKTGECRMRCSAGVAWLVLAAGIQVAAAQPFPAADTLTAQQLQGRNLFNQSCMVCHVKLQITSPAKYGPDLSKNALGGREAVMREVISNGTPNMPGFKYHFDPDQIDAIVSYVKTLPAPPPNPSR
jgi:mono/diheme cytochrome c family protein